MSDFTIGVDFGTQSVRAIVVRCSDGTTISESTFAYPHGVLDRSLPDGTPLPGPDWALADPNDYMTGLIHVVHNAVASPVLRQSKSAPSRSLRLPAHFCPSTRILFPCAV